MTTAATTRKDLEAALRLAAGMAHGVLPIMRCVLVRTAAGALEIAATDGAGFLRLRLPAECGAGDAWAAVVSPKTLAATLRLRPAAEIAALTIADGERLRVDLGSGALGEVPSLPAAEFPADAEKPATASWRVLPAKFAAALQTTATAASTDETRNVLESVHLSVHQGVLTLTATDGRRVHRTLCEATDTDQAATALIRSADAGLLQAFLGYGAAADAEARVRCAVGEGWLAVEAEFLGASQRLALRQVEGLFPDTAKVIPQDGEAPDRPQIVVEAAALAAAVLAVRRVEATDSRETAQVRLRVDLEGAALLVDSGVPASPEAYCTTLVAADLDGYESTTDHDLLSAVLDAQFADEWLQSAAAAGGKVTLTLRGARQPVSLERPQALAVVMPMTV